MGKLKNFQITFKNKHGVCYSGETLAGAVTLECMAKIKIREIRLRFHGYASVHWSEKHSSGAGKNKRTVTKHYSGEELYFDHTVKIFECDRQRDCERFEPGKHSFPFEFCVPESCPTSYEGSWGKVRYFVMASVERMFSCDNSIIKGFTVVNSFNLNDDPRTQECVVAENEMSLCCLCCKSGPIAASLTLNKIGFVPGEGIPIQAEISNRSNRRIVAMTASLQMIVKYHASKKTRTHCNVIATITRKNFGAGKMVNWTDEKLAVPAVPSSFLRGCGIIDISYILELAVYPSGPSFNLPVKMEVIIGTTPLKPYLTSSPSSIDKGRPLSDKSSNSITTNQSFSPITQSSVKMAELSNDKREAVVYRESVLGEVHIEDEDDKIKGPVHFCPVYPYMGPTNSTESFTVSSATNNR